MSGLVDLYRRFGDWVLGVIPKLVAANAKSRDEIIDVVSGLAEELQAGLDLAVFYLRRAKRIDDTDDLRRHIDEAQGELLKYCGEFKICLGLRKLRDRFNRLLDPLPASISIGQKSEVQSLLTDMENDEVLIIHELRDIWPKLQTAAAGHEPIANTRSEIDNEIRSLRSRSKEIGEIANSIIDSM